MCLYPGSGGFYCFGCHAHGDAIALYGKALNLTNLEAARQVCRDFGFQYDEGKRRKRAPSPLPDRRREAHYGPTGGEQFERSEICRRVAATRPKGAGQPTRREAHYGPTSGEQFERNEICRRVAATRPKGAGQPTRRDARALAKRLEAMREKQADGLLERMRSAQEIIMQMASSKAEWDAVLDDMQWRRALQEQSIAQDQLAMLDGMTLAEFYEHVREGGPLRHGSCMNA